MQQSIRALIPIHHFSAGYMLFCLWFVINEQNECSSTLNLYTLSSQITLMRATPQLDQNGLYRYGSNVVRLQGQGHYVFNRKTFM